MIEYKAEAKICKKPSNQWEYHYKTSQESGGVSMNTLKSFLRKCRKILFYIEVLFFSLCSRWGYSVIFWSCCNCWAFNFVELLYHILCVAVGAVQKLAVRSQACNAIISWLWCDFSLSFLTCHDIWLFYSLFVFLNMFFVRYFISDMPWCDKVAN